MPSKDNLLLPYNCCSLFRKDLSLLEGPCWLNDKLIGFYMDYLEREVYKDISVCFIRPEITQCLKLSPDLNTFLDPIGFKSKDYAVMIVNDCRDPTSAGGTHWSLLVYCQEEHTFYHLDSFYGENDSSAIDLSKKIALYVGYHHRYDVVNLNTLQQKNSYDCGVFVLCHLDNVLNNISRNGKITAMEPLTMKQVSAKRADYRNLIISLHNKEVAENMKNFDQKTGIGFIENEDGGQLIHDGYTNANKIQEETICNYQYYETEPMEECENDAKSIENLCKNVIESCSQQAMENEIYTFYCYNEESNANQIKKRHSETLEAVNQCRTQSNDGLMYVYKRIDHVTSEPAMKTVIGCGKKKLLQVKQLKKTNALCTKQKISNKHVQQLKVKGGSRIKSSMKKRCKQRGKLQEKKQRIKTKCKCGVRLRRSQRIQDRKLKCIK